MVSAAGIPRRWRALVAALALLLPVAAAADAPSLFLEADLEPPQGHVQAQALYTLRFFQAIDVRDLELHAPAMALAELRRVGEDRVGEASRDGRRYRVTERRYAVFPYASGELVLAGGHATGLVAAAGREPVRIEARPVALAVRPIPPEAGDGAWVPARALVLSERWESGPETARAGEALRRTLRVEATGVDAARLPALDFAAPGFAVHAEPPRLVHRLDGDLVVGIREQTFRVVPLQAGALTLPALGLAWWEVPVGRLRTATLAARRLEVAPGAVPAGERPPGAVAETPAQERPPVATPADRSPAAMAALAGPSALLAVAALVWLRVRPSPLRALRRACRRSDPLAARRALLAWSAGRWPAPPRSLGALAARLPDPAIRAAVLALDRQLYGPAGAPWDGSGLARFPGRMEGQRPAPPEPLPPLHSR